MTTPESVRKAWLEAAEETGINGMGMNQKGMLTHISQLMAERILKWSRGETDHSNVLGDTVESAIQATEDALYDLNNPLEGESTKSIEIQRLHMQEKAFYEVFLAKLKLL